MDQNQLTGILDYLPTIKEKKLLQDFVQGQANRQDAINNLCECEKFMVSILGVKHAKRKVRALIFKLQFMNCIDEVWNGKKYIFL